MAKQIIAVDLDDVLSASAEGFAAYSDAQWGGLHKPEQYLEEWAVFWGVPLEEALLRSSQFHASDAVAHYRHFEDALPVLSHLKSRYDLVIVTSRRALLKAHTDAWLDKHFPGIFTAIHYAGIWDADHKTVDEVKKVLKNTKAAICGEVGANYLIDDQPKHCIGAAQAGITSLLFGDYAWGKTEKLPPGIHPVKDWKSVQEFFDAAR
jgi:5'(3')-deoxyribonucleotidase